MNILLAVIKLGLQSVLIITLNNLSYVIADNKLALNAGWDDEKLKIELEDLKTTFITDPAIHAHTGMAYSDIMDGLHV